MPPGVRLPPLFSRILLPCAVASVAIAAFFHLDPPTLFQSDLHFKPQSYTNLNSQLQHPSQHHVSQQPLYDTTTDMAPGVHLKVLICGGGIAGNALAFWLTKLGHNVTVLERYPGLRATGLQ